MILNWVKCGEDRRWCSLERLNLNNVSEDGITIIWCSGDRVVKVGQGDIRDRLSEHRRDNDILRHRSRGQLLVSWARESGQHEKDGIERYLGKILDPIEGKRFPDVEPIEANLPWEN